jgi:hypothetical protein
MYIFLHVFIRVFVGWLSLPNVYTRNGFEPTHLQIELTALIKSSFYLHRRKNPQDNLDENIVCLRKRNLQHCSPSRHIIEKIFWHLRPRSELLISVLCQELWSRLLGHSLRPPSLISVEAWRGSGGLKVFIECEMKERGLTVWCRIPKGLLSFDADRWLGDKILIRVRVWRSEKDAEKGACSSACRFLCTTNAYNAYSSKKCFHSSFVYKAMFMSMYIHMYVVTET